MFNKEDILKEYWTCSWMGGCGKTILAADSYEIAGGMDASCAECYHKACDAQGIPQESRRKPLKEEWNCA